MFKFLRKYNKWILAVGGTLLLITFLIPFAFQGLGQMLARRGATWATVGRTHREKVSVAQLQMVRRELELLKQLGPLTPGPGQVDEPGHWYLLVREAEQAGLVPSPGGLTGASMLVELIAARTGESPAVISNLLAKRQGVMQLIDLYLDGRYSDTRLKQRARRLFHLVEAQLVPIEAGEPADPPSWTDEQLAEQLKTYADVPPGEGEMGFGYRLPDRAKLEWLVIDAEGVRRSIAAGERLNPVALYKHWKRNSGRFGQPEPGAAVPQEVRDDLLETLTAETLEEIARDANDRLRLSRRGLPQRDGYFVIGETWQALAFPDLGETLRQEHGIPLPAYHARGERWLSREDLAALPGIGTATTDKFGTTPKALPDLAMSCREFAGPSTIPMQEGIAGPPLRGPDGSVYLFRVTDTDPARPPRSVDEARGELVADLNRLADWEQLVEQATRIERQAIEEGLLAVALEHDTAVRRATNISLIDMSRPVEGVPTALPVVGAHEPTVAAIVDRSLALPADVPVTDLSEQQRTFVLPVQDRLTLLVVRLVATRPLTEERYRDSVNQGMASLPLLAEEFGQGALMLTEPFSFESLIARHGFRLSGSEEESPQEQSAAPPPDETASMGPE